MLALCMAMLCASLTIGGLWLVNSGLVERTVEHVRLKMIAVSTDLGFTVEEILVMGRDQTTQQDLLKTIQLSRGVPILAIDLDAAKRRLETLPWVRSAAVERILPNTIMVRMKERTPLALWQNKGRFALIDVEGKVILREDFGAFSDLLQVVGEDAPGHAADLLAFLSTQPELLGMVKAAVWVGDRRWNILMDNGINVRLPEEDPQTAWARLADYDRTHKVLDRDVQTLDLRLPDRLIVQKPSASEKTKGTPGRET